MKREGTFAVAPDLKTKRVLLRIATGEPGEDCVKYITSFDTGEARALAQRILELCDDLENLGED